MVSRDDDFTQFVESTFAHLCRAAFLLTGDHHEAEDLAQATLARTYVAWNRVHRSAHGYARTTLLNLVTDRWRRPYREHATADIPEQPTRRDPPEDVADRQWLIQMLLSLPPQERAVVVLRHYFDLTEAQTAAELKVSLGTVKSTNSRALSKLRISVNPPAPHPDSAATSTTNPAGPREGRK
jgi:RNA polymerase sigma-70 factor (sigma-E family)